MPIAYLRKCIVDHGHQRVAPKGIRLTQETLANSAVDNGS
jgi:hypothetical protein